MYRVVGIKGVLPKERLDEDYASKMPSFWLTRSGRTIKLFDGTTLSVNGEYRKPVFTRILRDISKAGDRLHAINREKYVDKINDRVQKIVGNREKQNTPVVRTRVFKV